MPHKINNLVLVLLTATLSLTGVSSLADDATEAREIVDDARRTFDHFVADPNMTWFRDNVKRAKGVLIVPQLLKAGFIFGASGGTGVFLARDDKTGQWSDPAFYTMGSATFGLQIGAEAAEVALMVMTEKGLEAMLSTKFQLGADASIAAGPVGAGAQAATVDILQFARTKGIFGGLTVEGAVIAIRDKWNHIYYGKEIRPVDILVTRKAHNRHAAELVAAVSKAARPDE